MSDTCLQCFNCVTTMLIVRGVHLRNLSYCNFTSGFQGIQVAHVWKKCETGIFDHVNVLAIPFNLSSTTVDGYSFSNEPNEHLCLWAK